MALADVLPISGRYMVVAGARADDRRLGFAASAGRLSDRGRDLAAEQLQRPHDAVVGHRTEADLGVPLTMVRRLGHVARAYS